MLLASLSRRSPPQLRAAIASAIALLGLSIAPQWVDAIIVGVWLVGGIIDWLAHVDRDGDGEPDVVTMLRRRGWSAETATEARDELLRVGPAAVELLRCMESEPVVSAGLLSERRAGDVESARDAVARNEARINGAVK